MRSLGGILIPFDIGKAFRFYLSSRPGCLCHNSCHLGNHWTYIHNMGIGEAENHGDGDGITIDDGDDNLGILWGGGTLQGRRSDTSPPATTWNVQLLHSPSQVGHSTCRKWEPRCQQRGGGWSSSPADPRSPDGQNVLGKLFFSTGWLPSKQGSSPATTLRRGWVKMWRF